MPDEERILLAHGGGGLKTKALIEKLFWPRFQNRLLGQMDDSACLDPEPGQLAFTTDGFVVDPLFFPGGDIGRLAACGTLNDLVMQGAQPLYVSMSAIIEEGFRLADLERAMDSLAQVLKETGALLAAGDTKVVERGRGSGLYLSMAGIGRMLPGVCTHCGNAREGDAVILTGTLGDHGAAIMALRHGFQLTGPLASDVAPLWGLLRPILEQTPEAVHVLRDPTRGGLAAALADIAAGSHLGIRIFENRIPVRPEAMAVLNLLGLDPLQVANEGKAVVLCAPAQADRMLEVLKRHPLGQEACQIGQVEAGPQGRVTLETSLGGQRIVDIPSGEALPRIC